MSKFSVFISEIQAALLFCSSDDSRYVLNAVHFEAKEKSAPLLIATDGRRMVAIETKCQQDFGKNGDAFSITLSKSFLAKLCAFAKTQSATLTIEPHPPKRVIFSIGDHLFLDCEEGAVVDGNYPNWRQALPAGEKKGVDQMAFASSLLADFHKAGKILGCESTSLKLGVFDQESPIEVLIAERPNFYAILMPLKYPEPVKQWQPTFLS